MTANLSNGTSSLLPNESAGGTTLLPTKESSLKPSDDSSTTQPARATTPQPIPTNRSYTGTETKGNQLNKRGSSGLSFYYYIGIGMAVSIVIAVFVIVVVR